MADLSKIKLSNEVYNLKDDFIRKNLRVFPVGYIDATYDYETNGFFLYKKSIRQYGINENNEAYTYNELYNSYGDVKHLIWLHAFDGDDDSTKLYTLSTGYGGTIFLDPISDIGEHYYTSYTTNGTARFNLYSNNSFNTDDYVLKQRRNNSNIAYYIQNQDDYDFGLIVWDQQAGNVNASVTLSPSNEVHITGNTTFLGTHIGPTNQIPAWVPTDDTDFTTKAYVDNLEAKKALSIPIATVDSTSIATAFTVQVPEFENETQLRDGLFFYITNDVIASVEGWTLQVNNYEAKPVYNVSGTRTTTGFALNRTFPCWYNSSINEGAGAWVIGYLTDTDTNTNTIGYQVRTNSQTLPATDKFYRYRLLFTSADNEHLVPANTSSSTNATANRTPNQKPINPFGPIYYYSSTTVINANANPGATAIWEQYALNLGYSFAKGSALTMTLYKPVYLKCAPQLDGSAIIDSTTSWVQDLPTTKDGQIYIFLGIAYSATNIELMIDHPVYYHDGTAIRIWTGIEVPQAEITANVNSMLSNLGLNNVANLQPAAAGTAETDTAVVM